MAKDTYFDKEAFNTLKYRFRNLLQDVFLSLSSSTFFNDPIFEEFNWATFLFSLHFVLKMELKIEGDVAVTMRRIAPQPSLVFMNYLFESLLKT